MKRMHRIHALLIIAALILGTAGCGKTEKPDSEFPVYVNATVLTDTANAKSAQSAVKTYNAADYTDSKFISEAEVSDMPGWNTEEYNVLKENSFMKVSLSPFSTFAMDVDTGSYTNFRRLVNSNSDIPSGAVRTEEFLNYFDYTADSRTSNGRFTVTGELHSCPWNPEHGLLSLLVSANPVQLENKGNNFVFLIDTSGSMGWDISSDEASCSLELAVKSFELLTDRLTQNDKVSLVTYSGVAGMFLNGCTGDRKDRIKEVLHSLSAGGGTNGSGGIEAAYNVAMRNYIEGGNNRVIIASDGDMNLGITSTSGLVDLITEKKESGVFLTTLGFGEGNYSDANMESIADAGNGNYFYIDSLREAEHVLVDKMLQTTVTVAKDVKLQAEFNPELVSEYRLLGYENRVMAAEDFKDDSKDGGEVGAGAQVMVLYELVYPSDSDETASLKYQTTESAGNTDELLTLSVRYKEPDSDVSAQEDYPIVKTKESTPTADWYFCAGIAEVTGLLHGSSYFGDITCNDALELIRNGAGDDLYRNEFEQLTSLLSSSRLQQNAP